MLLAVTAEVPDHVIESLRGAPGILSVKVLHS